MSEQTQTQQQSANKINTSSVKPGQVYEVQEDGRWAFFFDHHQISGFSNCEAYFREKHMPNANGKVLQAKGSNHVKTLIGQWWAKYLEWYYTALANKELDKKLACDFVLESWKETDVDRAKAYYPKSYEDFAGTLGATTMAAQYFDFSYGYDVNFWKIIGIEAGFGRNREVMVGENKKVIVYYIGKPDLMVEEQGRIIPIDHKTKDHITSDLQTKFKPHAQTAGYLVAGQVIADKLGLAKKLDRVIINCAARLEPSDNPRNGQKKPRFLRIPVDYSQEELQHWREQVVQKATRLRYCIENNEWLWNDKSCHVYSGCEFRPLHSRPEGARLVMVQAHYQEVDPWIPYDTEGE
jgi:hypothetical protein